MQIFAAYSTLALTIGMVLARPRIGAGLRVHPAVAALLGVVVMLAAGVVHWTDLGDATLLLWRPLLTIACIMVTTAVAQRLGVLDTLASLAVRRAGGSATRLFGIVFGMSALTAAVLNNDAAVLLLTPLVVSIVRARYPGRPQLLVPFAFAVFLAAGVAPLVVSNPMNMVVASYAGIGFNEYALRMAPVALAGSALAFTLARLAFRRELGAAGDASTLTAAAAPLTAAQRWMLALLGAVLGAYPVASAVGAPIWPVAAAGASIALFIAWRSRVAGPASVLRHDVAWGIVVFLTAVFILATGLRNVGVVKQLSGVYAEHGLVGIGVCSALGSAVLNNHPMAILNMLALGETPGAGQREVLTALIGGDLGPRLLPMGSLAGLLWLEALRRQKVEVSVGRFVALGALVTVPCIVVSIALLALLVS